jgi:hypothetical protein
MEVTATAANPIGSMETPRTEHTATKLSNGDVLVTGGMDNNKNVLATAEIFDPPTATFAPTGSMGTPRAGHTAVPLNTGKVLVAGGVDSNSNFLATAEIFDPGSGTFSPTGGMNAARSAHTATLLQDGRVLVTGGQNASGNALASAELFDPASGTFTSTGSMNAARAEHSATLLQDGRVLVTGGQDAGGNALASAELFDPANGTFTLAGSMNTPRFLHSATLLNDNEVLVAGGRGTDASDGAFATAELFDPASGTFALTGSMNDGRFLHTATLLGDGTVLVAGGAEFTRASFCRGIDCGETLVPVSTASAELFDTAAGTFSLAISMETPRLGHTATLLNDGAVLVAGGTFSKVEGAIGRDVSTVLATAELFQ